MAISDIKAKRLTGTGAASIGRTRIKQIQVLTNATGAGRLTITDGDGGATVLDIDLAVSDSHTLNIPANGVVVTSDVYVSAATNITALTVFYA